MRGRSWVGWWAALVLAGCSPVTTATQTASASHCAEVDAASYATVADAAIADGASTDVPPWRLREIPARVETTPTTAGVVRDAVIWFARRSGDDESVESVWLAHQPDGAVRRLVFPRAVFAWEGSAFTWRVTPRTHPLGRCPMFGEDGSTTEETAVDRSCNYPDVDLVSLADGRPKPVFRGHCHDLERGERQQQVRLVGQLGPWLLVDLHDWVFACGLHGNWITSQFALDLRGGGLRAVDRDTPDDFVRDAVRVADARLRRNLRRDDGLPIAAIEDAGDDPVGRFDAFWPRRTVEGVSWRAFIGAETCYMCPPWGRHSYWTDVTTPLAGLPDAVRSWTAPPAWAAEFSRRRSVRAAGWSTFVGTAAARDLVLQRLRAMPR